MAQENITLREITKENIRAILRLAVHRDQERYVATNGNSIAEAHVEPHAWFRAIYADETPIGFILMYIHVEEGEYYIWRYMIDVRHQAKGYGKAALRLIIDYLHNTYPQAEAITLSHVPENKSAAALYTGLGFVHTGEIDAGEQVMRLTLR